MGEEQLESPASQHAETSVVPPDALRTAIKQKDKRPEQIGPYKILQTLGEGGMGMVYLAEQREPILRRVALKVVKAGMDTREVVARFEAERQALATLDHPNIARVYDAGETEQGRPYFAMEHVPGVPITEYCDLHRVNTNHRLELFSQVCDAVQHAHQNAIIHRDLKPSNVLVMVVSGKPSPKIIDFGVAKATNRRLTDKTIYTEVGQLIGTPEYMSPEQAEMSGLSIDTRSDIYSLGVLLYELLVGALPFDSKKLRKAGYVEVQRIIREEEPPLLSTRLDTISDSESLSLAERRGARDVAALSRELKGDLDWIVAKAMEKDRNRRYSSASELWADIERHLRNEPVMARSPSTTYRLQKFVRRHKAGVAASALITLALLAGVVATISQAVRAMRAERVAVGQREIAEREARKFRSNNEFLVGMLAAADPDESPSGKDVKVREVLDSAAAKIGDSFAGQPEVEASVRSTLGSTYHHLGLYDLASPHLTAAHELRRAALGEDSRETLASLQAHAELLRDDSKLPEAEAAMRAVLAGRRRALGEEHRDTLASAASLADLLRRGGRLPEAESLGRQALEARERTLGAADADTLESRHWLALALRAAGKLDEAESLLRAAADGRRKLLGPENTRTLRSMNNLASVLKDQGRLDESESLLRHIMDVRRRRLSDDHPQTLTSMNQLALVLQQRGRFPEAEELLKKCLEGSLRVLGEEHQSTTIAMSNLANLYRGTDRLSEAEPLLRRSLDANRRRGETQPSTLASMLNFAAFLRTKGDLDAAAKMYRDALDLHLRVYGESNPRTLLVFVDLGACLTDLEKYEEAETALVKARDGLAALPGASDEWTAQASAQLVRLYEAWGKPDLAAKARQAAAPPKN